MKKHKLWLSLGLALIMVISSFAPIMSYTYADTYTAEQVKEMIGKLPDTMDVTEANRAEIEAAEAAFNALSPQDQEIVNNAPGTHSSQPLGRDLEAAVWGLRACEAINNSTTMPEGTYNADSTPKLTSSYSKGKSTSSRQKPWSIKSVTVSGGTALATVRVESKTYKYIRTNGTKYELTRKVDNGCEFDNVPIKLNDDMYIGGFSSSMGKEIAFKITNNIDLPEQEPGPDPQEPEPQTPGDEPLQETPYSIENKTNMFKGIDAYMMSEGGKDILYLTLSGTGYHEIFKGSYDDAVATGDDSSKWISGKQRTDESEFKGKWQFAIPVEDGETLIPVQALSHSHQQKGHGNWWYPRYVKIDREKKSIETGDYVDEKVLTIENKVKMFKPKGAVLKIYGGIHSNGYKKELELTMGSSSFDKAYVGSKAEAEKASETVALADGKFIFIVEKIKGTGINAEILKFIEKDTVISFHSVKNDKWYERKFSLDEANKLLTIEEVKENEPAAPTPNPEPQPEEEPSVSISDALNKDNALTVTENGETKYVQGESKGLVIEIKNIDLKRLISVSLDGKLLNRNVDYVATQGSIRISFTKEYLDKLNAGEHKALVVTTKGSFEQSFLIAEGNAKPETKPQASVMKADEKKVDDKKTVNTADDSNIMIYAALLISSVAAVCAVKKKYSRNN